MLYFFCLEAEMQSRTHSEPGATYTAQILIIKARAQKHNENNSTARKLVEDS